MSGFRLGGTTRPKMTVAIDVDGVLTLAPYSTALRIDGPPREGAVEWLASLLRDSRIEVFLFTTRAAEASTRYVAQNALRCWLAEHGLEERLAACLNVIGHKAPAHVYIDDRGWHFDWRYPSADELVAFRPWWDSLFPEIQP